MPPVQSAPAADGVPPVSDGGKVVVTGSLGGIGGALCRALTDAGYAVCGVDRHQADAPPGQAHYVRLDLADPEALDEAAGGALAALVDWVGEAGARAVVHNAAWQVVKPLADLTWADAERSFRVNVMAPLFLSQRLLPALVRGRGCVVHVGSVHGALTKPQFSCYAASKAALASLTRSMALELGEAVPVFGIEPGAVDTAMLRDGFRAAPQGLDTLAAHQPLQRLADPAEVAALVTWLVQARPVLLSGSHLSAGGGIAGRLHDPR
jgi:NAD(P)-dependent dehydrogenase (short-subunit alcohol dehydrogenase family)